MVAVYMRCCAVVWCEERDVDVNQRRRWVGWEDKEDVVEVDGRRWALCCPVCVVLGRALCERH